MDYQSRQLIIDHRLSELRAEGIRSQAVRGARRDLSRGGTRARLARLVLAWRRHGTDIPANAHDRRSVTSRPA